MYDSNDDGTNDATPTFSADYEMTEDALTNQFTAHNYDIVFIIGNPKVNTLMPGPVAYDYTIAIQPVVIEKYSGNRDIPVQLLWNAHNEIRRIIRENATASCLKLMEGASPKVERLGSTLMYMDAVDVGCFSTVSSDSTPLDLVTTRRFIMRVKWWEVGTAATATNYKYVGPESGLGPLEFDINPKLTISIPTLGGTFVRQLAGLEQPRGKLHVRDLDAITQLLRTIDVVAGGGVEKAVPTISTRNVIGYFGIVTDTANITNTADTRTSGESHFTFVNTMIDSITAVLDEPYGGFDVNFTFDSVSQADS